MSIINPKIQNWLQIQEIQVCESTNLYLKNIVSNSKPMEGLAILAHHQTAGKGQIGNTWWSEAEKSMTFSLLLTPKKLPISKQFFLSMAVSLGVLEALHFFIKKSEIQIKWPNDILCNGKKIGGILIENSILGEYIEHAVVGIGINVQNDEIPIYLPQASSIKIETQKQLEVIELVKKIAEKIKENQDLLEQKSYDILKKKYLMHIAGYQEKRIFEIGSEKIWGEILGVNEHGKLVLNIDGKMRAFDLKEITWIYA